MGKIEDATENMIRNLEEKTGKPFSHWLKIAQATQITKHRELINFLQTKSGLTYGYANLVALKTLAAKNGESSDGDDLIAAQYAGAKADLRPIYESLITAAKKIGDDVEISPKKTYVSLRRKKQFAIIQATTTERVDVGINLKSAAPAGRLEKSGSFNSMVSHRVKVSKKAEVDKELLSWLKKAYEAA